jgi:RHS repeat-associated protein
MGDALDSVRQMTDHSGEVTYVASYDPYGNVMLETGTSQTSYGYTGEDLDRTTGMVYLRARYYSPNMGRFITRDNWTGNYQQPMSYNGWLYGYGNPINYTDLSGERPSECRNGKLDSKMYPICRLGFLPGLEELAYRTENAADYPPYLPPPMISWSPEVMVNLATDIPRNTQAAEENINVTSRWGGNTCGQIVLALIMETISGQPDLLGTIWENTNPKNMIIGTMSSNLEPAVWAILNTYAKTQKSNWRVTTYTYQEIHSYTATGDYVEQSNQGQWDGPNHTLIAPRFEQMLQLGHYVIVLTTMKRDIPINTDNPWGTLTNTHINNSVAHWVVLTGMSQQWDETNEASIMNWVRVNNPYSNQEQYYPWKFFKDSMTSWNTLVADQGAGPMVMEIWHTP